MAMRVWLLHATTARVGGPHLLLLVGAHSVVNGCTCASLVWTVLPPPLTHWLVCERALTCQL